jgi:pSer/pThr/pTyr-binding forkhead associated (FHA) protein
MMLKLLKWLFCGMQWFVTDTSSNGTFINGQQLEKGVPHVLKFGDTLGLASNASRGLYE